MPVDYVSAPSAPIYSAETGGKRFADLLWGDRVRVVDPKSSRTKVRARGWTGWVANEDLGGESLLEIYVIDVGQGDGILIRTPDHRHIMVDGGYRRAKLTTGKNAADFVDWKFAKDYGQTTIHLDAMIASHCDADHYGGLWDLLDANETHELDTTGILVDNFYHAGVSWWQGSSRDLGPKQGGYLTRLLGNRASVGAGLTGPGPRLQGEWADFLQSAYDHGCPVSRLSHATNYLPGFEPQSGHASIRVLGPVEYEYNGSPVLRWLGSYSKTTNGQSIVLRVDHGNARVLLTGDLNAKAQRLLLEEFAEERWEFACDVTKGCHHGSEDVSYEFLTALNPSATVISSGDNEGHSHPRPSIVAASALTGYVSIVDDAIRTPLIYSTEISRSIALGTPTQVRPNTLADPNGNPLALAPSEVDVDMDVMKAGDLRPTKKTRNFGYTKVVAGIRYGLVNVRTDGRTIMCATMNEKKAATWDIKTFPARP